MQNGGCQNHPKPQFDWINLYMKMLKCRMSGKYLNLLKAFNTLNDELPYKRYTITELEQCADLITSYCVVFQISGI